MKSICFLLLLATASGQSINVIQLHTTSMRWVEYYAAAYRVPLELVQAIIDEESGWNPFALSSKGAAGIMQLMPQTAVRFGVHNRFRIEENIRGGVAYLGWLRRAFDDDLRLVTAAYYVGEGPIRLRRLAYSSPEVYTYVTRVARRYRSRRLLTMRRHLSCCERKVEVIGNEGLPSVPFSRVHRTGGSARTADHD